VLAAQHNVGVTRKRATEGQDAHETLRQHLEQVFIEWSADLDAEPRLLTNFARERGPVILAGFGSPTRQIPLIALVHQQQHAALVQHDAFHG